MNTDEYWKRMETRMLGIIDGKAYTYLDAARYIGISVAGVYKRTKRRPRWTVEEIMFTPRRCLPARIKNARPPQKRRKRSTTAHVPDVAENGMSAVRALSMRWR